jgi:tRNA (guanosine-2'-O-)-methyltransferase
MNENLIEHLSQFISERRLQLFDKLLDLRTRYLTVVLENIYQAHNASAVLRSCECFGIQDVHIIEDLFEYKISPDVALGSNKWLNLYRYNRETGNTENALRSLKEKGYRIAATTPHKNDCNLEDFNLHKGKTALVFGAELKGLSTRALDLADEFVRIPMVGFTESLNISVTAALCIHHLAYKMRKDETIGWKLSQSEKQEIKLAWLRNSIKKSELIEKTFIHTQKINKKKES